jgi:hypothetical protein
MFTLEELRRAHPNWTEDNLAYCAELAAKKSVSEGIRAEVLLETPCTRCGAEMGEHRFSYGKFICPST